MQPSRFSRVAPGMKPIILALIGLAGGPAWLKTLLLVTALGTLGTSGCCLVCRRPFPTRWRPPSASWKPPVPLSLARLAPVAEPDSALEPLTHAPNPRAPRRLRTRRLDRLYSTHGDHLADAHRAMLEPEWIRCEGELWESGDFAKNLATLLAFRPKAQVYHCSMSGFDTHADQAQRHAEKLGELASGLTWFWGRVQRRGLAGRTTVMVYSEFGRRAQENASGGTDHGTAGPVFLLGAHVNGGFKGEFPSLRPWTTLTSSTPSTPLYLRGPSGRVLGAPAEPVLGGKSTPLSGTIQVSGTKGSTVSR